MSIHKKIIIAVLALIVLAALVGREFPHAGYIASVITVMVFVVYNCLRVLRIRMKGIKPDKKTQLHLTISLLILMVATLDLLKGAFSYFLILILLATDFMVWDQQERIANENNNKNTD